MGYLNLVGRFSQPSLVLLNQDLSVFINAVDADQLASDDANTGMHKNWGEL